MINRRNLLKALSILAISPALLFSRKAYGRTFDDKYPYQYDVVIPKADSLVPEFVGERGPETIVPLSRNWHRFLATKTKAGQTQYYVDNVRVSESEFQKLFPSGKFFASKPGPRTLTCQSKF